MKTIKECKSRMKAGTRLFCVENTFNKKVSGTYRIVTKFGATRWCWRFESEPENARVSHSDWPPGIKIIDADTFRIPLTTEHYVELRFAPTAEGGAA